MSMLTPELVRAVHEDRRRRLVAEADARRVHRELEATRRAGRPVRRGGGWLRAIAGGGHRHHDAKIARLAGSWMDLDHRAARSLAAIADEVDLPAGAVLEAGRFAYIGLDDAHRGLVVTTGTPPVTLEAAATVLVVSTGDLERLAQSVPRLAGDRLRPARSRPLVPARASAPASCSRVGDRRRGRVPHRVLVPVPEVQIVGVDRTVAGCTTGR